MSYGAALGRFHGDCSTKIPELYLHDIIGPPAGMQNAQLGLTDGMSLIKDTNVNIPASRDSLFVILVIRISLSRSA